MAKTDPAVLTAMQGFHAEVMAQESGAVAKMVAAWGASENALGEEIKKLAEEITDIVVAGGTVTPGKIYLLKRYQYLQAQIAAELSKLAAVSGTAIEGAQVNVGHLALEEAAEILGHTAGFGWNRLETSTVEAMVGLTAQGAPLEQLLWKRVVIEGKEAAHKRLVDTLVSGSALGWGPSKMALAMKDDLSAGLSKAMIIARTETMRVYRESGRQQYEASGVVQKYRRMAAKDGRTCLACLLADGRVSDVKTSLADHPHGRCAMVPIVDGAPEIEWEKGPDWLLKQPEATQRKIMGPGRYEMWKGGQATLEDLVRVRRSKVWGKSVEPASIKYIKEQLAKPKLEDWTKFGAQAGSNEGGWFRAPDGSEWYAKRYDDPQKAKAEVVARSLYAAMGFETPESSFLTDKQGRLWQAGKKLVGAKVADISNPQPHTKDTLLSIALLADRDWNKSQNHMELAGKPVAMDCGCVFTYRAKATSAKPYTKDPLKDLQGLHDYDSTGLWSNMAEDDWRRSRARLEVLTDTKIDKAFRGSGLEGLADTVKARRDALIDYAKGQEAAAAAKAAAEAAAAKAAQKKVGKLAPYKPLDFQGSRQAAHQHFRSQYGTRRDTLKRLWSSTAERTPAAAAVESYKGNGYDSINHLARKATHAGTKASQVPQAGSNTAGKVDWMDRCFERAERLKQDTNLIRWFSSCLGDTTIHVSDFNNPAKLANLIGMEYRDSGFASSSVYPDWIWRGNVRATIRSRKGTAGLWIDPEHAYEGEWLLDRGMRYKVIAAKMVGSDLHIEVEIMEERVNARKAPR